jgi:hypothetical protein
VNLHPTLRDINIAIDALDAEDDHPFIILEVPEKEPKNIFLQTIMYSDDENKDCYNIEAQIGVENGYRQYGLHVEDKTKLKKYFEEYFLFGKFPDISTWTDITTDILMEENRCGEFDPLNIARSHYREDKKILNCYGLAHGAMIQNIRIVQPVAESILLLKDVLNLGNCGDVYFNGDKNWIYINITIPEKWRGTILHIKRFSGYITKNDILKISCYDHGNMFIQADIKPLEDTEKLLPLFILFFTKKMLRDDTSISNSFDYFVNPGFEKFKNIYIDFMKNMRTETFYVAYKNCDEFDFSRYTPLSGLLQNFRENVQRERKKYI